MNILRKAILYAIPLIGGCLLLGLSAIGCEETHHRNYYYQAPPEWYQYDEEGPYWGGGYGYYGGEHERHEWAERHEGHEGHERGEHHRR